MLHSRSVFYSLIAMKINLPFQSHSVVKVITNACLLILIISAVHILSVFVTFDSHIVNLKIIDNLTTLKMSTSELIYASHYYPQDMTHIIQEIDGQLHINQLFKSSWFNTKQINKTNQQLLTQWENINSQMELNVNSLKISVSLSKINSKNLPKRIFTKSCKGFAVL